MRGLHAQHQQRQYPSFSKAHKSRQVDLLPHPLCNFSLNHNPFRKLNGVNLRPYLETTVLTFCIIVSLSNTIQTVSGSPVPTPFAFPFASAPPEPQLSTSSSSNPLPSTSREVICRKPNLTDLLTFYVTNYLVHVFSVKSEPGDGFLLSSIFAILSFGVPYVGILRAVRAIYYSPMLTEKDDLMRAARSGALCVVARTKYWSTPGRRIGFDVINPASTGNPELATGRNRYSQSSSLPDRGRAQLSELILDDPKLEFLPETLIKIHGQLVIPVNKKTGELDMCYRLARLPRDCDVEPLRKLVDQSRRSRGDAMKRPEDSGFHVANSYNAVKGIAAIAQIFMALSTLVKAGQTQQYKRYGYAAYALTVIPYALMSFANFICLLVTPDYPAIFMIKSKVMREARERGYKFEGCVGRLVERSGRKDTMELRFNVEKRVNWIGSFLFGNDSEDNDDWGRSDTENERAGEKGRRSRRRDQADYQTYQYRNSQEGRDTERIRSKGEKRKKQRITLGLLIRRAIEWAIVFFVSGLQGLPKPSRTKRAKQPSYSSQLTSPLAVLDQLFNPNSVLRISGPPNHHSLISSSTVSSSANQYIRPLIVVPRIGILPPEVPHNLAQRKLLSFISTSMHVALLATPYIVIGILTQFKPNNSTVSERVWVMLWLVFGQLALCATAVWEFMLRFLGQNRKELWCGLAIGLVGAVVWCIPAVGGFVIVGIEMWESGYCTQE